MAAPANTSDFDYLVIGSGFCCLAFVERALGRNRHAKILVIERGPFFVPEHLRNLPLPYQQNQGGLRETFPWTLSEPTRSARHIRGQHGIVPFFGGRSILWSGWCPRPTVAEMAGWPRPVIEAAKRYFRPAEKLLNVLPASRIDAAARSASRPCGQPVFDILQARLLALLESNLELIPSATRVIPAPLSLVDPKRSEVEFGKYSVPGPLLALADKQARLARRNRGEPLRIVTDCLVRRIVQQENRATALETSRGVVPVGDAKIVLAMGTLPPTTLVLNSFPQVPNAGTRFTSHSISSIIARVPRQDFEFGRELGPLEMAAAYLAGIDRRSGLQYHLQLTGLSDRGQPENDAGATAARKLLASKDHLVFVCAALGEMNHRNRHNWLRLNGGDDPTTNVTLQVLADDADLSVWDTMDRGAFQTLEQTLSPRGPERVEYWHGTSATGDWKRARPPVAQIRLDAPVHEGSTLWIGNDGETPQSPVGLDYRPRGVENVYLTGGGLWPAAGSWNSTLTMVALSQHLADQLSARKNPPSPGDT